MTAADFPRPQDKLLILRRRAAGLFLRVGTRALFERSGWVGGHQGDTSLEVLLALQWQWGLQP